MQYKNIISSALTIFLLTPIWATAIDPTTSGKILDTFKSQEIDMIFDTLPFSESDASKLLEHEYALGGLEALKSKLEQTKSVYQERKDVVTEKRMTLEDALATIMQAVKNTESDITETETQIADRESKIKQYQALADDLNAKIQKNRKIILEYLANIYSEGNMLFDTNNTVDLFQSLILSDKQTDELAMDITYKSLVSVLGQNFVNEYRSLVREYSRMSLLISGELKALESDKTLLETQKRNLALQYTERERLLEITQGEESRYESYIKSQQEAQDQVEKSWQAQQEKYIASLDQILEKNGCNLKNQSNLTRSTCDNILDFYRGERLLKDTAFATGTTNILSWPLQVTPRITAYYKDPSYYATLKSHHEAIDIGVPQGTPIYAPADGYVSFLLSPSSTAYSFFSIKHAGGYTTVYGHVSDISVSQYQFVRKGDLIGKSGGAVGTLGAGPMTSGPHLHFEVWKDRETIDPLRVLDTTVLNYADLPSRYQDKYIADIVEKTGDVKSARKYEQRFVLKGETEEERQKYLLSTYAASDFQNWQTWVDTALEAQIDPSFLMCVGLSETTLGNHLKTRYNVGNVGNTDSGATVSFSSAREGIKWMVATFNNRFLGKYNSVSDLSRWGNTNGPIYASSNSNWHNNTIRCLSALKGRWVEDDFKFRIK